ncbi:redox-sensitive transcriptional activator SoxR [Kangiella sp. TOML190]|uniref:redox-sensitive transcriptional activator SoxR n=1 Tax=Kangiella sp. TOML190 TaxID=2931351 RepID=UPI00203DFB5F|nr:redox-sensitive transcriptional activator SoxR [Kangiella sp. TOML190]
MTAEYLSVGKVAKRCGVNVSALHFYEKKGLIRSQRNAGNQRIYQKSTLRRIALIKAAQQLGISLDEIKQALDSLPNGCEPTAQDWQRLSRGWEQQLAQRIERLQRLQQLLTGCIGCGCLSMKNCPIYNPDDQLAEQGTGAVLVTDGVNSNQREN